jgi:ABC-type cobalamin/Fe3+-siderophores transport system ATPase subunit
MTNSIISIENLKVELGGVSILDIPSFCIAEKEFVSLIGPNGSGKSTLLLVLNSLLARQRANCTGRRLLQGRQLSCTGEWFPWSSEPLLAMTTQEWRRG